MRPRDVEASERCTKAANIRLTLAADVEHSGMIGHCNSKAREDKVCRVVERVGHVRAITQRAFNHDAERINRVVPDRQNHDGRDDRGQDQRQHRDKDHIGPVRHLLHQAASP